MTSPTPCPRTTCSLHRAARVALPLTLATLLAGACAHDGFDWRDAAVGGSVQGGDRPTEAPPVPDDLDQAFEEAIDATRSVDSAALAIELEVGPNRFQVEGELAATRVAHVVAEGIGNLATELRSDGETAWLRVEDPDVVAELPDGVRWIQAPYEDLHEIGVVHDLDEAWEVLPIVRGIDSVDDLGVDEVAGVPVRRLRGDVDFEAALDDASPEERSGLEDTLRLSGGNDELVAEVGMDGDGRVRSLHVDVEVGGDQTTSGPSASLDYEVQALNQPVEAPERPPSDETVQLDDVPGLADLLAEAGS